MSPTYIANAVSLLVILVTALHIDIAPEAIQTTVSTIVVVVVPIFTMIRQLITKRSTIIGTRPK